MSTIKDSLLFDGGYHTISLMPNCEHSASASVLEVNKVHSKALLLVTFGSTYEGPHRTYARMLSAYKEAFPEYDIFLAFTSTICIERWARKSGNQCYTPDIWLNALGRAGYEEILLQSLHIIPGQEYLLMRDTYARPFATAYPAIRLRIGEPLLSNEEEARRIAQILYKIFLHQLEQGEAVAFMGHGNANNADYEVGNRSYHYVQEEFARLDSRLFLSTVEYPNMTYEDLLADLNALPALPRAVNLVPLMSVAGDHACNDMAGDYDPDESEEEQSWKVKLRQSGYVCADEHCHLKGLGDFPELQQVWIEHTRRARELFCSERED